MSEDTVETVTETPIGKSVSQLESLVQVVKDNAEKGAAGNKQAARRARVALNDIKKACTPLRIQLQEAVKGKTTSE